MPFGQRAQHVEEQRLAQRPGFLGPVQHGHLAGRRRQRRQQRLGRERAVQPHRGHAHLLAAGGQVFRRLRGGLGSGPHDHDYPLGGRIPGVVDQVVRAAGACGQCVHGVGDGAGDPRVERVDRLPALEVHVGILGRAADEGAVRGQPPAAVVPDQLLRDERAQVVVGEQVDGVQLVGGPEPVEEVHERHPRRQRGGLRDQRQVVCLLDARRGEQREAGLPHRHHVGVIAEDRQALRRERPGGHVQDRGGELPGDLVHVGDHQQQALRRGERGGQGPALQRAVQRPRRAALALHLDHGRHACPTDSAGACWTTRQPARPSARTG